MKRLFIILALLFSTPAFAQSTQQLCYTTSGTNCVPSIAAAASAKVSVSTNTTTEIVALASGKKIYVTSFELVATAANTAKWVYGTGSACGTGQADLTGAYGMTTFTVISKGDGLGAILFVPASNALCIITTASQQLSGSVSYVQY